MNGFDAAQHFQTLSQRSQDHILRNLGLNERFELLYWLTQVERQKLLTKRRDARGRFLPANV